MVTSPVCVMRTPFRQNDKRNFDEQFVAEFLFQSFKTLVFTWTRKHLKYTIYRRKNRCYTLDMFHYSIKTCSSFKGLTSVIIVLAWSRMHGNIPANMFIHMQFYTFIFIYMYILMTATMRFKSMCFVDSASSDLTHDHEYLRLYVSIPR